MNIHELWVSVEHGRHCGVDIITIDRHIILAGSLLLSDNWWWRLRNSVNLDIAERERGEETG